MRKKIRIMMVFILIFGFGCAHQKSDLAKSDDSGGQGRPKNVIMMIGDGMGIGQIEIARLMEKGKEGNLFIQSLPHVALVQTWAANHFVPDSASAGTALAAGIKTDNKMVGMTPDGQPVDSILDKFKQNGKKVGVISTNPVTDATPASFVASVKTRYEQPEIARQLLSNEVDVILGGGARYFGEKKQKGPDLIPQFKEKGYGYATTKAEMLSLTDSEKVLGLFHKTYMTYVQDREEVNSQEPSLFEMTKFAIDVLSKSKEGFFLMSEGARIDHAAHAADVPGVWKELIDFDKAVEYAVNWAEKDGNTLVIVIADHETLGFAATEPMNLDALRAIKVTPEYMASKFKKTDDGKNYTLESIKAVFKEYANIDLKHEDAVHLNEYSKTAKGDLAYPYRVGWEIGSMITEYYGASASSRTIRARSKTGGHTANMIPIFAYGLGAESFEGVLDNTQIPKIIMELVGS
jgi:alkaline phosphatase